MEYFPDATFVKSSVSFPRLQADNFIELTLIVKKGFCGFGYIQMKQKLYSSYIFFLLFCCIVIIVLIILTRANFDSIIGERSQVAVHLSLIPLHAGRQQ